MKKIILASGSPRRRELMIQAQIPFEIRISQCEERITKERPDEVVLELSAQKAEAVAWKTAEEAIVIGADTVVALDGRIMGKPHDAEEAFVMIKSLQGKVHQVWTGVSILECKDGKIQTRQCFAQKTDVEVYPMKEEEIWNYIEINDENDPTGKEWEDKAGGYGIQSVFGAKYIKKINGDYYNVVGLPIARLYQNLKEKM
ncbi:MAG: Maf family protein [Eubacteriales bacterium]|nr:Maf family protein [Eubacteriales bacterium]